LGRKTAIQDPDLGRWGYEYDANGNLLRQTDTVNNVINLSYDALGRVLAKNFTEGQILFAYDVQYAWTLANYSMSNLSYAYTYDERLRPVTESIMSYGQSYNTSYIFDSSDKLLNEQDFSVFNYRYNHQGLLNKINNYVSDITYDAFGAPTQIDYQNTLKSTFAYDANNHRLSQIKTYLYSISPLQELNYQYDLVGNVLKINDSVNARLQLMIYDYLDRLITAKINGVNYTYEYDSLGRIRSNIKDNVAKHYNYGSSPTHAPSSIITEQPGVKISGYGELPSQNKNRNFEFMLNSEVNGTVGANWSLNSGAGSTIQSSIPLNVSQNSSIWVIVQNNYSYGGDYLVNISGIAVNSTSSKQLPIKFGVRATELDNLYNNGSQQILGFDIGNDLGVSLPSPIYWACNNSLAGTIPFYLAGNETLRSIIASTFTKQGKQKILCNATSQDGNDYIELEFNIHGLEIEDFTLHDTNATDKAVAFRVHNYWDSSLPTSWNLSELNITSNSVFNLSSNHDLFVIVGVNYSTSGEKSVSVAANSSSFVDSYSNIFRIKDIEIQDYALYATNATNKVIVFDVYNYWPETQSINWNLSDPQLNSGSWHIKYRTSVFCCCDCWCL
jgi:YD repeat-containing protein